MTFSLTTFCIKCHFAECHYAECCDLFIVVLNVVILNVVKLSVVMLSVVAPFKIINFPPPIYFRNCGFSVNVSNSEFWSKYTGFIVKKKD
jgi:hypothetical protein